MPVDAAEIQAVFRLHDTDLNGTLDKTEFHAMLIYMGILLTDKDEKRLFDVMDEDNNGTIDETEFTLHYSTIVALEKRACEKQMGKLRNRTTFSPADLEAMHDNFKKAACSSTNDGVIDKQEFMQLMASSDASRNSFLYDALFKSFDADKSGGIDFIEFVTTLAIYHGKASAATSPDALTRFFFDICSGSSDGWIRKQDMEKLLGASVAANGLKMSSAEVTQIVDLTFAKYSNSTTNGKIDFKTFQARFPTQF